MKEVWLVLRRMNRHAHYHETWTDDPSPHDLVLFHYPKLLTLSEIECLNKSQDKDKNDVSTHQEN